MENQIKVVRYRNTPYIYNFITNGGTKRYEWAGSKNGKYDVKLLPVEAVDWLMMNSICFKKGELVIVEDSDEAKEIVGNLGSDLADYANNTHSKEDIIKILQGNYMTMQKRLKEITVDAEKKFVIDVAKEFSKELAGGKLDFLADWIGVPKDILFD